MELSGEKGASQMRAHGDELSQAGRTTDVQPCGGGCDDRPLAFMPGLVVAQDGVWQASDCSETDNLPYISWVDGLSPEDLQTMVEAARQGEDTVRSVIKATYPRFYRYMFDVGRTEWRWWTHCDAHSKVLDCGCGWGNLALELAQEVGHVYAVDCSRSKLQFLRERADNVCPEHVSCVHWDFNSGLPLADNSVDMVVLNGVLEWVGAYCADGRPEQLQRRFLKEVSRVLCVGGELYVGIENRFGSVYWFGQEEDHVRVYGVNLLPRWLANRLCRRRGVGEFRVRTHSVSALRQLLAEAGLETVTVLSMLPDYKYFSTAGDASSLACLKFAARYQPPRAGHVRDAIRKMPGGWRLERVLNWTWFVQCLNSFDRLLHYLFEETCVAKRVVPSLGVIARKPAS